MGEGTETGRDPDFKSEEGGDLEEVTAGAGLAWGLLGERPGASCVRNLLLSISAMARLAPLPAQNNAEKQHRGLMGGEP